MTAGLGAHRSRAVLLVGICLCWTSGAAWGQGTDASRTARGSIPQITVTAQRRSESLEKAAIPVTAVRGVDLAARGVTSIANLGQLVPAVQINAGAGPYNGVSLRGVATTSLNAFADPAIAINMDGIYLPRPTSAQGLFYDINRVEVLKGPQGTLYGRNATGGAINIISNAPVLGEFGGDLSAEGGSYSLFNMTGDLNVPVTDQAALRGAFQIVSRSGYFSDGTSDEKRQSGRLSLKYEPNDSLTLTVRGDYTHLGGKGTGATAYCLDGLPVTISNPNTPGKSCPPTGAFYGKPFTGITQQAPAIYPAVLPVWTNNDGVPDAFIPAQPLSGKPFQDIDMYTISAQLDWQVLGGTLTLIPAYRNEDVDYLSEGGFELRETSQTQQETLEARFTSGGSGPLQYVLGAYYLNDDSTGAAEYDGQNLIVPPTVGIFPPAPNIQLQHTDNTDWTSAAYGQGTYSLTKSFRLVAGLRYTYEEKTTNSNDGAVPYYIPLPGAVPPAGPAVVTSNGYLVSPPVGGIPIYFTTVGNKDWSATNWKAGFEWDVAPNSLLYANYSTGFKSGGFYFSPIPGANSYKPERLYAYTVGSKNRFFDDRVQLNLEAFYWDYKNQQVATLALIPPFVIFPEQNAKKATIEGGEVEFQAAITPTLLFNTDIQYTYGHYDDYTLISAFPAAGFRHLGGPAACARLQWQPFVELA
jgi:iron complex outermembrane receptor protein